jgi:hypothetical protein
MTRHHCYYQSQQIAVFLRSETHPFAAHSCLFALLTHLSAFDDCLYQAFFVSISLLNELALVLDTGRWAIWHLAFGVGRWSLAADNSTQSVC